MSSSTTDGVLRRRLRGRPSEEIVLAVAELADVDPLAFGQRLNDVVDPDALDALADWASDPPVALSFPFESHVISLEGDELVVRHRSTDG